MNSNLAPKAAVTQGGSTTSEEKEKLPLAGLLALTMAGFIVILTEALPAGLLPQIATSLRGSEAVMGQLITVYALGSLIAAIPLAAATQGVGRRKLLLTAIAGFGIVNTITAVSDNLMVTLVARFFAGVFAGLVWAMIAGYAARMVPERLKGRAIAVAMAGTPLALTVGIPAGTYIGGWAGWRMAFGLLSGLTVFLMLWIVAKLPEFPGERAGKRRSIAEVFVMPGVRPVLAVTLLYILTHNLLYTYISPLLALAEMAQRVDSVLLVFGITSLFSLWAVGVMIDSRLRQLVLLSISIFAAASLLLAVFPTSSVAVYLAVGLWGLAFGGAATLLLTGLSNAAGKAQDVAQSMMVTVWNIAIGGGGLLGGLLLGGFGAKWFAPAATVLLVLALLVTWSTRGQFYWRGAAA